MKYKIEYRNKKGEFQAKIFILYCYESLLVHTLTQLIKHDKQIVLVSLIPK